MNFLITYANDFVQNFVYNKLDLLSEIWYTEIDRENGSPAYTYEYDKLSRLFKVRDYTINPDSPLITEYEYNDDGAISKVSRYTNEESPVYINTVSQTYDKNNRVSAIKRTTFYDSGNAGYIHTLRTYAYSYNSYGSLTKYALESGDSGTTDSREYYSVQYSYDKLNRLSGITSTGVSSADELTDYFHNFTMHEGFAYENTNVSAYNVTVTDASNNTNSTANTYQYDANGNITKIITVDTAGEYSHEYRYYYDNLGQLIRVDDARENRTVVYTYDDAGNITKKERYALTAAGATPSGTSTVYNYTYSNSAWRDQLTAYNGTSITYDAIGNPTSYYNGATFEWEGRQLVSAVYNSNTYTYTYDDNGMRSSRTKHLSDGTTEVTNYTYNGNLLVSE